MYVFLNINYIYLLTIFVELFLPIKSRLQSSLCDIVYGKDKLSAIPDL